MGLKFLLNRFYNDVLVCWGGREMGRGRRGSGEGGEGLIIPICDAEDLFVLNQVLPQTVSQNNWSL